MADILIPLNVKTATYYDPDLNAPDRSVYVFPDTASVQQGARIKLASRALSATEVVFRAQGVDTIANPQDPGDFQVEHLVTVRGLIAEYQKVGTQWKLLNQGMPGLLNTVTQNFIFSRYGGLRLSTPVNGADIGAAWVTVDVFDVVMPDVPKDVVPDVPSSSLNFPGSGVYVISLSASLTHDESNQGRAVYVRMYNLTKGIQLGNSSYISIARNQPGTDISIQILVEVDMDSVGDAIVPQIGNGSTLTGVVWNFLQYFTYCVSEFRGVL